MPPVGFEPTISAGERPAAAHLLGSWVRIPPGVLIFICSECRVISGRGLCDELITRPVESYRLCCVVLCDLDSSRLGAPYIYIYIYIYDISNLRINEHEVTCFEKQNELIWYLRPIRTTYHLQYLCTFLSLSEHCVVQVVHSGVSVQHGVCRHVIANAVRVNAWCTFPPFAITSAKWEGLVERYPPFHLNRGALWINKRFLYEMLIARTLVSGFLLHSL
jgi:hypothetical protein